MQVDIHTPPPGGMSQEEQELEDEQLQQTLRDSMNPTALRPFPRRSRPEPYGARTPIDETDEESASLASFRSAGSSNAFAPF